MPLTHPYPLWGGGRGEGVLIFLSSCKQVGGGAKLKLEYEFQKVIDVQANFILTFYIEGLT